MAEENRPVGDKSTITATQWEAAALASAALTLSFCFIGITWMIGWIGGVPGSADALRARAQVFTAGFASLAAVVTFCTVAWRAKVTERQATAQERQLESADENNLAVLLQKGAEFIAEEVYAKKIAGIACLEAVVTAENKRFGNQGMSLLVDLLKRDNTENHLRHLPSSTRRALRRGHDNGNRSSAILGIDGKGKRVKWRPVWGVAKVIFRNADLIGSLRRFKNCDTVFEFENVRFDRKSIGLGEFKFRKCTFTRCAISGIDLADIAENSFQSCDFSGCDFTNSKSLPLDFRNFTDQDNFFDRDAAPKCSDKVLAEALAGVLVFKDLVDFSSDETR